MNVELTGVLGWIFVVSAVLFLLRLLFKVLRALREILYPYVLGRPKDLKRLAGSNWAVITGSTDGIGKAYALEVAKHGFNLVLISRNQQKLDAVAQKIHEAHPQLTVQTIAFDFRNSSVEEYESKIFSVLDNLPIGLLINNVGVFFDYPEKIHKVKGGLHTLADTVIVNSLPVTLLSARIIGQMTERNRGVIVNVSSAAGFSPVVYVSVYSAIKKYMRYLSAILRKEYSNTRIHIQTVCPCVVATKMSAPLRGDYPKFLIVSPRNYVRHAVRSIGLTEETTGCLVHQLQYTFSYELFPQFIMNILIRQNLKRIRQKAIEGLEREQAGTSSTGETPLLS